MAAYILKSKPALSWTVARATSKPFSASLEELRDGRRRGYRPGRNAVAREADRFKFDKSHMREGAVFISGPRASGPYGQERSAAGLRSRRR